MKSIKLELKWALLFSVMTISWIALEKLLGLHDQYLHLQYYLTNLFAIPAILLYVFALNEKKKKDYKGFITYSNGLKSGLILTLFIAALSPGVQWIVSTYVTPSYFSNVIAYSLETGHFKTREEAIAQFNYRNYAQQGVIGALLMGILTTAIVMIFIRSKPTNRAQ